MKILVLDACALHLGFLGCYGNHWVGTPNLDRLASQGIVADWHFVDTPETQNNRRLPDIGILPEGEVRVRRLLIPEVNFAPPVIDALPWLAEPGPALLWVDGPNLAPPWNLPPDLLSSYFEEDDDEPGLVPWPDPPQGVHDLSEEELLRLQNTYAAVITSWDARLGEICENLDESVGLVVTARSGLPLGEHGLIGFTKPWLHDEVVHVPLVVRAPGHPLAGTRCTALTQPADLDQLLKRMFQGDLPSSWFSTDRTEATSTWKIGDEEEWALRTSAWALLWPRTDPNRPVQFYAKPDDRREVNNLSQQQMEMVEAWQKRLEEAHETAERATYSRVGKPYPLTRIREARSAVSRYPDITNPLSNYRGNP